MIMILMIVPMIQPMTMIVPQRAEIQMEVVETKSSKTIPHLTNLAYRNTPGEFIPRVFFYS